ncbi:MAG: hypothetical protein E2P05_07225 [Acidobacteria bacterium]|nr:MAG: hypothetical protein E2P05_07225 [Acidobacteriota bacterium]
MVEATGNMAQVSPAEAGEKAAPKKTKKTAPKAQAAKAEKVETAPEQTNGAKTIDELEPVGKVASSTTEEPLTGMDKIYKDREDLTEKMLSGQVEESVTIAQPQYIDAPIFPDAYCPKCGQKLSGNSKTGFKQSYYTHPFTPAIALGKPCELKGKKLRAPVARMEIIE